MSGEEVQRAAAPQDLVAFVRGKANALQNGYIRNEPWAAATLARLRRGVGRPPGADIALLGEALGGLPYSGRPRRDELSDDERAAYTAITLFAMHQQSQRSKGAHQEGYSLGRAAAQLQGARDRDKQTPVQRRFVALATAGSWAEAVQHARGLIQLMRSAPNHIPLDYGRFARDLKDLRSPVGAQRVRLAWGRDFYRVEAARAGGLAATDETYDNDVPENEEKEA